MFKTQASTEINKYSTLKHNMKKHTIVRIRVIRAEIFILFFSSSNTITALTI